jgi:hypothetical protein
MTLTVYNGTNGTGAILASAAVLRTGLCGYGGIPNCGGPNGTYGVWRTFAVPFSGAARSVRFSGPTEMLLIDDVVIVPADAPASCTQTYWLWNPRTNAPVRELENRSASCVEAPYNIEVRPCGTPRAPPVVIVLKNASKVPIKRQSDWSKPFYLWGDEPTTGDVFKNKKPLPRGKYWLYSSVDGVWEKIKFINTC